MKLYMVDVGIGEEGFEDYYDVWGTRVVQASSLEEASDMMWEHLKEHESELEEGTHFVLDFTELVPNGDGSFHFSEKSFIFDEKTP